MCKYRHYIKTEGRGQSANTYFKNNSSNIFSCIRTHANTGFTCIRAKRNSSRISSRMYRFCARGYNILRMAQELNQHRKPEPSELIFQEPKAEPELPLAWRQTWRVAGREWGSPSFRKVPGFPGSSPATSPTVDFKRSPKVPWKFPRLPRIFPEVSPFLWETWHPLLTHKNFLWLVGPKGDHRTWEP